MDFNDLITQTERHIENLDYNKAEKLLLSSRPDPNDAENKIYWNYYLGKAQIGNGNPENATRTLITAQKLIKSDENIIKLSDRWEYKIKVCLARSYLKSNFLNKALVLYEEVSSKLDLIHNEAYLKIIKAESIQGLGETLWLGGDLPKSLYYLQRSLLIYKSFRDIESIAILSNKIVTVFRTQGRLNKALTACKPILAVQENVINKHTLAILWTNLGHIYFEKRKFQDAEDKFFRAMLVRKDLEDELEYAEAILNIIRVKAELNELNLDLEIIDNFPTAPYKQAAVGAIKNMIAAIVEKSKNNLSEAENYWLEALNISGISFSHQILCFEGQAEIGLLKWMKNKDDWLNLTEIHNKLDRLRVIALKNSLVASISKAFLIQAKLSFALKELHEAHEQINDCLKIANKHDLELIKVLAQLELQKIRKSLAQKENTKAKDKEEKTAISVEEEEILEIQRMLKSLGG